MSKLVIQRSPSQPGAAIKSAAGAAMVDITPHFGLPMAGYSTMSKRGEGRRGRLYARCLYLHEDEHRRVAICVIDQMSASRYLLEKVASVTAVSCGLSVDRVVLAGTHTHKAPGNFFGNGLYDALGQCAVGFDKNYADWLSVRIADCVERAVNDARPAEVGYGSHALWGVSRNRSYAAFLQNLSSGKKLSPSAPRPPWLPEHLSPQFAIDPRARALAAFEPNSDTLIGALATFGCHPTTVPHQVEVYSPDWGGEAQRVLRRKWRNGVVAIGSSGGGDVTAFDESHADSTTYFARCAEVGAAVGEAIVKALDDASRHPITVTTHFAEIDVTSDKRVDNKPHTELANSPAFGVPTLGGSEESRSSFHRWGWAREGKTSQTDCANDRPQVPKVRAFGKLQGEVARLMRLQPSKQWPLHAIDVSGNRIVTIPGEPTVWAAWQIEQACQTPSNSPIMPLGWAGDYNGYFTTEREYLAQHYEGSSTLWGRYSTNYLAAQLHKLTIETVAQTPSKQATFPIPHTEDNFAPHYPLVGKSQLRPVVSSRFGKTVVSWFMPSSARHLPGDTWFVRLERKKGHDWLPLKIDGQDFDDIHHDILIRRDFADDDLGVIRCQWHAEFVKPSATSLLRAVVRDADGFPGFTKELK